MSWIWIAIGGGDADCGLAIADCGLNGTGAGDMGIEWITLFSFCGPLALILLYHVAEQWIDLKREEIERRYPKPTDLPGNVAPVGEEIEPHG